MVQTTPSPFEVGRAFVHQYYTLLHQAPNMLHRFYSTDSTFVHGGVDRPGSVEQPAVGPENIAKRINDLNLRDCHAKIRQVDSHPTLGGGVVVQVTGELSNNGDSMRRFMQTFVLAPRQPKKYYVQNDIFRYQDEVFDDASDDDDHSSSQVFGDTDKVSNPDSSVAVSQPPVSVNSAARVQVEEHQALPPRRPPQAAAPQQQPQVAPDSWSQQQEPSVLNQSAGYHEQQETTPTISSEQQQQQQQQQALKQGSTEGASYAGIAKLKSNVGPVTSQTPPPSVTAAPTAPPAAAQPSTSARPSNVKPPTTRTNNPQRPSNDYYRQNNRGQQWGDHSPQDYRSNTNQLTAPNEQQVFVGSLPADFTREALIDCFEPYGKILDVKLNTPLHDNKKNFGFVIFEDPNVASSVVQEQHVMYHGIRLNVEPKTHKVYGGGYNNGAQGNMRNNNYVPRGARGGGGNRPPYRNGGNNPRRGGGPYHNNSPQFDAPEENNPVPQQS